MRDVLCAVSEAGLALIASKTKGPLWVYPAENITPELATAITEYKAEIIRILREDEEMRRTGIIQSERQVFEMTREHFGLDERCGMSEELFLTWASAEVCDLARKSYSYIARVLPFYADLEVIGGADRRVLEAEKVRDMEAFVDALRELTQAARAETTRERRGAA